MPMCSVAKRTYLMRSLASSLYCQKYMLSWVFQKLRYRCLLGHLRAQVRTNYGIGRRIPLAEPLANAAYHTRSSPERAHSTGLSWSLLFAIDSADPGNVERFSSTAFSRVALTPLMSDRTGIAQYP